jgi:hypothetical protein
MGRARNGQGTPPRSGLNDQTRKTIIIQTSVKIYILYYLADPCSPRELGWRSATAAFLREVLGEILARLIIMTTGMRARERVGRLCFH